MKFEVKLGTKAIISFNTEEQANAYVAFRPYLNLQVVETDEPSTPTPGTHPQPKG